MPTTSARHLLGQTPFGPRSSSSRSSRATSGLIWMAHRSTSTRHRHASKQVERWFTSRQAPTTLSPTSRVTCTRCSTAPSLRSCVCVTLSVTEAESIWQLPSPACSPQFVRGGHPYTRIRQERGGVFPCLFVQTLFAYQSSMTKATPQVALNRTGTGAGEPYSWRRGPCLRHDHRPAGITKIWHSVRAHQLYSPVSKKCPGDQTQR